MAGSVLRTWSTDDGMAPIVLCLPPAGAGAGQFRSWQERIGDRALVAGVQLPGREERWADPPLSSVDEAADGVVAALAGHAGDREIFILGVSFGGLLGYEVARRIESFSDARLRLAAFVVVACRPAHHWSGDQRPAPERLAALLPLLDERGLDEEAREIAIETLRLDLALAATYEHRPSPPIQAPVVAWGGDRDSTVSIADLAGWAAYARTFDQRVSPGGHDFWMHDADRLVACLTGMLVGTR